MNGKIDGLSLQIPLPSHTTVLVPCNLLQIEPLGFEHTDSIRASMQSNSQHIRTICGSLFYLDFDRQTHQFNDHPAVTDPMKKHTKICCLSFKASQCWHALTSQAC